MGDRGHLCLVLHAHLPYVREPDHEEFLEEDWLYEAIIETYLPLLRVFDRLAEDGVPFRVTMTLSPPLCEMLRDELLTRRAARRLDRLCALSDMEVVRTSNDPVFGPVTRFYRERLFDLRRLYHDRYHRDLVGAFRRLQDHGVLEIITCGATHGFLPLLSEQPEAVRAQIRVAAANYRKHFGRDPRGIWLPECGYTPGVERVLADEGIRYFFVDTHGVEHASPRPRFGAFAPLYTGTGVAAFARDPESSVQVWSAEFGYPGDPAYREFYRDVGYDLPLDYVRDFLLPDGTRRNTGLKYFRVTGRVALGDKKPYDPWAARERAAAHAGDFLFNRKKQMDHLRSLMGRAPVVVAPYDAELYGHWWFEGPDFLDVFIRKSAFEQHAYRLSAPPDVLQEEPVEQAADMAFSSWGDEGYAKVWLDPVNDWVYPHLHACARRMADLAREEAADGPRRRALTQAARELLLAQASDWAFIMKTGTMVPYAVKRTRQHLGRFQRLDDQLRRNALDEAWLREVETRDAIFPELDYRVFRAA
jgi:1,4-alpha-glucan branching enzyme